MRLTMAVLAAVLSAGLAGSALAGGQNILGYDAASSETQRDLERQLDASVDPKEMEEWMRTLSATPHHLGSRAGKENAKFIADLLQSWGFEVEIAEYQVLLPTPRTRLVELLEPSSFVASLTEESLAEDPSTSRIEELLPSYNAFSTDGDVEA